MVLEEKVLFTPEECKDVIASAGEIWLPSMLGKGNYVPSLRKSFVHNKRPKKGEDLYDLVRRGLSLLNEELIADEILVSILKYEVGGFIYKHKDDITTGKDGVRQGKYYMIGLLNIDFEGGQFIGYDDKDKEYRLTKEVGNVIIGDPTLFHEVTRVTEGTRYCLVCFITQDQLKITNSII